MSLLYSQSPCDVGSLSLPELIPNSSVVVAIHNLKGGTGKTAISTHIARYCALQGVRTLFIDCDPQGDGSSLFGEGEPLDYEVALAEFFTGAPIEELLKPTIDPNLYLIPNNLRAKDVPMKKRTPYKFAELLPLVRKFPITIIDCPPGADSEYLVSNALSITDFVVSPIDGGFSFKKIDKVIEMLKAIRERDQNSSLEYLGFILSKIKPKSVLDTDTRNRLIHNYGPSYLFHNIFPESEAVRKGQSIELTIFDAKPDSTTRKMIPVIENLTKELFLRIRDIRGETSNV